MKHGWIALLLLIGCAARVPQVVETQAASGGGNDPLLRSTHWVRSSAEYRAIFLQTYALATQHLEELAADRQPGTWAVAIDADETAISNSKYDLELQRAGVETTDELWSAWVARREAPPLPGVVDFLATVHALGGYIAVVTNRAAKLCHDTEENFRAFDIPFDVMLCRDDDTNKETRWRMIEEGSASPDLPPVQILMWIGDNIQDFPHLDQELRFSGDEAHTLFGDHFFLLPNPIYGSWLDNPPG